MRSLITVVIVILCLITGACESAGVNGPRPSDATCAADNATLTAQANAQAKSTEAQMLAQKSVWALQADVAKRCADRGMIPVFLGGNVDCKAAPK